MSSNIDNYKIGLRIKEARKKLNITQSELCNDLNISIYHYSKIENGHVSIRLDTLAEISKYLNVDMNDLLLDVSKLDKSYLDNELLDVYNKCNDKQKKIIIELAKVILKNG